MIPFFAHQCFKFKFVFKQVDIYFDTASENISCELIVLSSTSQRLHLRLLEFHIYAFISESNSSRTNVEYDCPSPSIFIWCDLLPSEDANNGEDVLRIQYMYSFK